MRKKNRSKIALVKPYIFVKDLSEDIIDRIYDNCTHLLSEQYFLHSKGICCKDMHEFYAQNPNTSVNVAEILKDYKLEKEDFISQFDGFEVVFLWIKNTPLLLVKNSPLKTKNAYIPPRTSDAYISPNVKGNISAFAIPNSWWHQKPKFQLSIESISRYNKGVSHG